MELISNNRPEDIEANRVEQEANSVLIALTANLMRVTRGAGRPEIIIKHVFDLAVLARRHFDLKRQWPTFWDVLSVKDARAGDHYHPVQCATDQMLDGALQMVASRLLRQIPQEAMGRQELFQGVHNWADAVDFRAAPSARTVSSRAKSPKLNEWDDLGVSLEPDVAERQERQRRKKLTSNESTERGAQAKAVSRMKRSKRKHSGPDDT